MSLPDYEISDPSSTIEMLRAAEDRLLSLQKKIHSMEKRANELGRTRGHESSVNQLKSSIKSKTRAHRSLVDELRLIRSDLKEQLRVRKNTCNDVNGEVTSDYIKEQIRLTSVYCLLTMLLKLNSTPFH